MVKQQREKDVHLPFVGAKVYYSGSISGLPEDNLDLPEQLVEYMQSGGATILDPMSRYLQRQNELPISQPWQRCTIYR